MLTQLSCRLQASIVMSITSKCHALHLLHYCDAQEHIICSCGDDTSFSPRVSDIGVTAKFSNFAILLPPVSAGGVLHPIESTAFQSDLHCNFFTISQSSPTFASRDNTHFVSVHRIVPHSLGSVDNILYSKFQHFHALNDRVTTPTFINIDLVVRRRNFANICMRRTATYVVVYDLNLQQQKKSICMNKCISTFHVSANSD